MRKLLHYLRKHTGIPVNMRLNGAKRNRNYSDAKGFRKSVSRYLFLRLRIGFPVKEVGHTAKSINGYRFEIIFS